MSGIFQIVVTPLYFISCRGMVSRFGVFSRISIIFRGYFTHRCRRLLVMCARTLSGSRFPLRAEFLELCQPDNRYNGDDDHNSASCRGVGVPASPTLTTSPDESRSVRSVNEGALGGHQSKFKAVGTRAAICWRQNKVAPDSDEIGRRRLLLRVAGSMSPVMTCWTSCLGQTPVIKGTQWSMISGARRWKRRPWRIVSSRVYRARA